MFFCFCWVNSHTRIVQMWLFRNPPRKHKETAISETCNTRRKCGCFETHQENTKKLQFQKPAIQEGNGWEKQCRILQAALWWARETHVSRAMGSQTSKKDTKVHLFASPEMVLESKEECDLSENQKHQINSWHTFPALCRGSELCLCASPDFRCRSSFDSEEQTNEMLAANKQRNINTKKQSLGNNTSLTKNQL